MSLFVNGSEVYRATDADGIVVRKSLVVQGNLTLSGPLSVPGALAFRGRELWLDDPARRVLMIRDRDLVLAPSLQQFPDGVFFGEGNLTRVQEVCQKTDVLLLLLVECVVS